MALDDLLGGDALDLFDDDAQFALGGGTQHRRPYRQARILFERRIGLLQQAELDHFHVRRRAGVAVLRVADQLAAVEVVEARGGVAEPRAIERGDVVFQQAWRLDRELRDAELVLDLAGEGRDLELQPEQGVAVEVVQVVEIDRGERCAQVAAIGLAVPEFLLRRRSRAALRLGGRALRVGLLLLAGLGLRRGRRRLWAVRR